MSDEERLLFNPHTFTLFNMTSGTSMQVWTGKDETGYPYVYLPSQHEEVNANQNRKRGIVENETGCGPQEDRFSYFIKMYQKC